LNESEKKEELISKVSRFLPTVEAPTYKQGFNTRIKWTAIALILYFVLSHITIYGVQPGRYEQFKFFEIVLGSRFGSLMTLGIGPIVTAGILLQLLVGSKIIDWDTTKPEGRRKFQTWNKFLAVAFCFLEAAAYVLAKALPVTSNSVIPFVILQLAAGGILVILLDDLVSKWGFGSGISLFIAAGVGSSILVRALSPFIDPVTPGVPAGLMWKFFVNIFSGDNITAIVSLLPIISTIAVFLIVVYAQDISVDIPLTFSALRGFGRTWSLKLFYTSNIPVILTAALIANLQLIGRITMSPTDTGLSCGLLGCFDENGNPASGIVYYLSAPRNLLVRVISIFYPEISPTPFLSSEFIRAITYTVFMAICAMIFSIFWVSTSGMDPQSVAEQIGSIGLQIPGFRRDPTIIKGVLQKYIPSLAVLGGLSVGLLAAFADFTGALGTGTGILLTVMIVYNYYEQLRMEKVEEAHPLIRKVLGE
jgi:preprotein translocase subunit SecY